MSATILVVEDNPITRKLVHFALENRGLSVVVAPDALTAIDTFRERSFELVLQDLCLPDMSGFELVKLLRALPRGRDVPILAFSGMLSHHDEARVSAAGFDDLVSKPIEPSRLLEIVQAHLPTPRTASAERFGTGRSILVADDDAVQRRLVGFRMQKAGFRVITAEDGNDALGKARKSRPDIVLSDVLMPELDGFGLCIAMKRDASLADIPLLLTTNSYVEPKDRDLARKAGAFDLVLRTPDLHDVFDALRTSLAHAPEPGTAVRPESDADAELERERMRRMMRQLERQVALNTGANQRCALLSAEISILKGISEALAGHEDIEAALRHTLAACFDAGGISLGALYLLEGGRLRALAFGLSTTWSEADLLDFFGEVRLLQDAIAAAMPLVLPSEGGAAGRRMLARAGAESALLVPVVYKGVASGALLMVSRTAELQKEDRIRFGEAVAGQISQALAVARAFEEKQASEQVSREQAAVLRSILDSIADGVVVAGHDGEFIHWNAAAGELVAMGPRDTGFEPVGATYGLYDADMTTPMQVGQLPLVRAIRGESVDGAEMYVRHPTAPDGQWLSVHCRPWRDDQGVARGGVAVYRDVTQAKATQSQLMLADRMASVGLLAAGVAHEINNPLACVLANLDLAQRELADRADGGEMGELREMLADARTAVDRVRRIVRDLKVFSRHEDARPTAVDLRRVIESSVRMAWNEIRHRCRLVEDYGDVELVLGSESRLGQVFLNLIVNAAQAIPEGDADANSIRIVTRPESHGRVCVEISDTGEGIAPQSLRNLFTPFFTTKAPGIGTGLGLAICHRIITDLGGEIAARSELGKGTTFRVILRAMAAHAAPEAARAPDPEPEPIVDPARRARVLVVDDEPLIAEIIRRTLCGDHDVVTSLAARDALARIRAGETFDVILCDLMMPQMTGIELHAALHELGPSIAEGMIFLTGGAFTPAARAFLDRVPNQRVEKPFDTQHLRALVNDRVRSSEHPLVASAAPLTPTEP